MPCENIFVFPGQGAQYAGMSKELTENFANARRVYECGSDILGFDLKKTVTDGELNGADLSETRLAQPAVFAASLASFAAAEEVGVTERPFAAAGHSLGEYAALVACGVLDIENGFKAIKARSEIMHRQKGGGMAAVLGLPAREVGSVCAGISGVQPVNYNSPQQTVIAGTNDGLEEAERQLSAKGAKRFIRLKVSAAFHSDLMKEAAEEFRAYAKTVTFGAPGVVFYSNVTGAKMTDFSDMPSYLARHICSPVRFVEELAAIEADGIYRFIETGPGKTLSGLVKKTLNDAETLNIEDIESLDKTIKAVRK
jgi:[acyl-carrier-protein] S-malonyltransferase